MTFSNNNQTSSVIVAQNQELYYISPETILPFGGLSSIFGLLAVMAIVAARKSKTKTAAVEYAYATKTTTRSFNSDKFYERLNSSNPYDGQYDHWDIKDPQPRKSAKDMTREEILAEAGIKVQ